MGRKQRDRADVRGVASDSREVRVGLSGPAKSSAQGVVSGTRLSPWGERRETPLILGHAFPLESSSSEQRADGISLRNPPKTSKDA